MSVSDSLSSALAVRLNLQISVSALPVVTEEMDTPLGRWVDSAPLPPENPGGIDVDFQVRVASDLAQVSFAMHGPPAGVIPKLGPYLRSAALGEVEEAVIDGLGGELEPGRVGSFVAIDAGGLTTGWLFPTPLSLAAVERHVPGVAGSAAARWAADHGVAACAGLWQAIGAARWTELVLAAPGTSPDTTVAAAAALFALLAGAELPAAVREAALAGEPPRVVARLGTPTPRVAFIVGGAGLAELRAIAAAAAVPVAPALTKLVATLGASEVRGVEYALLGGLAQVSALIDPSGAERRPGASIN